MAALPHPYPQGTRVRHYGEQYAAARASGTAVVLQAAPAHGSFEYEVERDQPLAPGSSRRTWWDAAATIAVKPPAVEEAAEVAAPA